MATITTIGGDKICQTDTARGAGDHELHLPRQVQERDHGAEQDRERQGLLGERRVRRTTDRPS